MATSSCTAVAATLNVTSTVSGAEVMVTMQAPVPPHAPPQPAKVEPPAGVGVSVTTVPSGKVSGQSLEHELPPAITVPPPLPRKPRLSVPDGPASKRETSGGGRASTS